MNIDWPLARRIAKLAAGAPAPLSPLPGDLAEMAADAERRVVAYTGLRPRGQLPGPEAIDRGLWIHINLEGMRKVLDPVVARVQPKVGPLSGPVSNAAGALLAAEVGGLAGLLSQRVLGQYELVLLDPASETRLLFVAPNLVEAATKLDADQEQLVRWVCFHEVTHAVQFSSVPWLQEHMGGLLRKLLENVRVEIDWAKALRIPSRAELEELVRVVREDGIVMFAAGPERRELLDALQATMAVIEGHAEHVMDAVGRDALDDLEALRASLDKRRANKTPMWKLLERLLGLDMKMKQYEVGKKFCDVVVAEEGVERLHEVFGSVEALPTWAELQDPPAWLARTATARIAPDAAPA